MTACTFIKKTTTLITTTIHYFSTILDKLDLWAWVGSGADLWLLVWPFLYSCLWFGFCSFCATAEERSGLWKEQWQKAFEVVCKKPHWRARSIWVPSTWNSNYANTLIFGILGACVQDFYSQCSNKKRMFPILLNNKHITRKYLYFTDF